MFYFSSLYSFIELRCHLIFDSESGEEKSEHEVNLLTQSSLNAKTINNFLPNQRSDDLILEFRLLILGKSLQHQKKLLLL